MLALPIFPGRPSIVLPFASVQWTLAGRKKPRSFDRGFVLALPIFPGSRPPSIVGVHVLNFCVRDGNRWTHMTINTNFMKSSNLSVGALCSRYLSSRAVARQVLSAYMSLTSVFGMGSDGSAAGGGYSDLSEWQRSAAAKGFSKPTKMPGTATGNRWTRPLFP